MISGRLACRIISAARSSAARCERQLDRMRRDQRSVSHASAAMSSGSSRSTGPGRSSSATRKASRTRVGIDRGETICRVSLVSGRIAATMSTIWNRACRDDQDGLLPGDHQHRHGAKERVGGARRKVQRARPQRRDAHAGLSGEAAVGRGHEGRGLLVAGQHKVDLRSDAGTRRRRDFPRRGCRRCDRRLRSRGPRREDQSPLPSSQALASTELRGSVAADSASERVACG